MTRKLALRPARGTFELLNDMTEAELKARMKAYVMGWEETGQYMEAERRYRLRKKQGGLSLEHLGSLFNSAVYLHPPKKSSGFVEFYRILNRSRNEEEHAV